MNILHLLFCMSSIQMGTKDAPQFIYANPKTYEYFWQTRAVGNQYKIYRHNNTGDILEVSLDQDYHIAGIDAKGRPVVWKPRKVGRIESKQLVDEFPEGSMLKVTDRISMESNYQYVTWHVGDGAQHFQVSEPASAQYVIDAWNNRVISIAFTREGLFVKPLDQEGSPVKVTADQPVKSFSLLQSVAVLKDSSILVIGSSDIDWPGVPVIDEGKSSEEDQPHRLVLLKVDISSGRADLIAVLVRWYIPSGYYVPRSNQLASYSDGKIGLLCWGGKIHEFKLVK